MPQAERDLTATISDMEDGLCSTIEFAFVVHALCDSGSLRMGLDPDECRGLARVLDVQMERLREVKAKWQRAFDLSRPGAST